MVRYFGVFYVFPFMFMARVGALEQDGVGPRLHQDGENLGQREIVGVRAFVIAPADMQPHAISGNIRRRRIDRLGVALRLFQERVV